MGAKAKKGKIIDKWRKKRYFSILAPKIFQERELGQTMAYEPAELNNRCISSNLMVLTGNIKKQDINLTFRITAVKGDTGFAMLERYEVSPAAIKRKVRRDRDRIDESFEIVTKDNKSVRIKPLIVTGTKISRSVRSLIRKVMMQHVLSATRKVDYDSLCMDVINDKLQKDTAMSIRKITPIRSVDIRIMKYQGEHKGPMPVIVEEKIVLKEKEEEIADDDAEEVKKDVSAKKEETETTEDFGEDDSEEESS